MIDEVVSPLLHSNEPLALVDNTELPQLFVTETAGIEGAVFGAAIPSPDSLPHPSIVAATL